MRERWRELLKPGGMFSFNRDHIAASAVAFHIARNAPGALVEAIDSLELRARTRYLAYVAALIGLIVIPRRRRQP